MASGHGVNLIGIDLGTTMSVIARLRADGTPETIPNESADPLTPSVIYLDGHRALVGRRAKDAAALQPAKAATFVKREMGSTVYSRTVDGRPFRPETLAAIVLRHLKRTAEERLRQQIPGAVITVPAFFDESRRKSTQDAGRIAGLEVYDILNEPTAAALAYGAHCRRRAGEGGPTFDVPGGEMIAVVYGLGGGAFDLTVVRLKAHRFEVLATGGDRQLGGKDWDEEIVKFVAEEFKRRFGLDPCEDLHARNNLASLAERTKIFLSDLDSAAIEFAHHGHTLETTLTRAQFEELTANLLLQTRLTTESVVRREANLRWEDVDQVLLVGGSTRMPMVRDMLHRVAGRPPNCELDPDQVVAHGAAIHAGILAAKRGGEAELADEVGHEFQQVECFNVNSHALGVRIVRNDRPATDVLIPKNTQLPCAASRVYGLRFAGTSTIRVRVLEGDSPDPDHNIEIGDCRITGLPEDLPRGAPIQVRLAYDASGLISVTALDMTNGRFVQSVIERHNGLTDADIAREAEYVENLVVGGEARFDVGPAATLGALAALKHRPSRGSAGDGGREEAAHGSEERPAEPPARAPTGRLGTAQAFDENVQFTVYPPKTVRPEQSYLMVAAAHVEEKRPDAPPDEPAPIEKVRDFARKVLREEIREYKETTQDSLEAVPRGGQITFIPEIAGVCFTPPQQSFLWEEDQHTVVFLLKASAALDGKVARGRMSVFYGVILLAEVVLRIEVNSACAPGEAPESGSSSARPYRKIFASYSHQDEAIVEQFERFVETLGDEYFRDTKTLRSGQRWGKALAEKIEEADVFQLFWSSHSMRSKFVRQEWKYALSLRHKGPHFVRPVYWEVPFPEDPPKLPPKKLRAIHFQRLRVDFLGPAPADSAAAVATEPEASPLEAAAAAEPIEDEPRFAAWPGEPSPPVAGEPIQPKARYLCPPAEPVPTTVRPTYAQAKRRNKSLLKAIAATMFLCSCLLCLVNYYSLSPAPADSWEEITHLIAEHKWAKALRNLEKFQTRFPEDPRVVEIPLLRDMCEVLPEVYATDGDPQRAFDLMRTFVREHRGKPGYEQHRKEVCLALAQVADRLVESDVREPQPEEFTPGNEAMQSFEKAHGPPRGRKKVSRAHEALGLLWSEGRDLNEPSIRAKREELAKRIAEADSAPRVPRPQ